MIDVDFEELLHQRIIKHCRDIFIDEHYKHASLEAMIQVELALKEKSGIKHKFGVNLCRNLFGEKKGIKLRVPFGTEMQEHAETLFVGAFSYYRNYVAHDGDKINKRICIRILIIDSELLDLIGASPLSFADIGGVEGLMQQRVFTDGKELLALLLFLDGYCFPDEIFDGFFEDLLFKGFSDRQFQAVLDTGLVEYVVESYIPSEFERINDLLISETIAQFQLSPQGKRLINLL